MTEEEKVSGLKSAIHSEQMTAAEQISKEVYESTGLYLPESGIISAANSRCADSGASVGLIKSIMFKPYFRARKKTRHERYGNTFLK